MVLLFLASDGVEWSWGRGSLMLAATVLAERRSPCGLVCSINGAVLPSPAGNITASVDDMAGRPAGANSSLSAAIPLSTARAIFLATICITGLTLLDLKTPRALQRALLGFVTVMRSKAPHSYWRRTRILKMPRLSQRTEAWTARCGLPYLLGAPRRTAALVRAAAALLQALCTLPRLLGGLRLQLWHLGPIRGRWALGLAALGAARRRQSRAWQPLLRSPEPHG